ncbi:hypothetical protein GGX14DRAFT_701098 [Mycena pura]|uniref:Uncharacterized protein n=1 Tax=Mycena pura TaxID=153505 RepID=A0AAD6UWM6_9AGAR|nr:hypothetical protein GGX14DRAFT_701098 [Mycena pura]
MSSLLIMNPGKRQALRCAGMTGKCTAASAVAACRYRDTGCEDTAAYALDNTLRPILNTAEVAELFSHPLAAFLSSTPPFPAEPELIEAPYHTISDWTYPRAGPNGLPRTARAHRFLTGREAGGIKPVAILIHAASIAHARAPDFEVAPPDALSGAARIAWALITNPVFKEAYDAEGIDVDWAAVRRVAGIGPEAEGPQAPGAPRRTRRRRSKL